MQYGYILPICRNRKMRKPNAKWSQNGAQALKLQPLKVVHDLKGFRDSLALGGSESFSPSCANLSSFPPLSNFRSRSSGWMLDVVIRGTVSSRS